MLDQFKWESVQEKVARELAAQLFPELKPEDLDRVSWSAFSAQLPFYGAHRLYRLIGMLPETNPPRRHECYALWDEVHEPFLINGESTTIHRANEAAPLVLRPEHFPDYIRFFMFGLLGGEGPFILVESPPDFSVPGSDVVASNAKALTFEGHDEIGRALYKAVVFYNGALFVATLAVDSKGDVEMVSDEPLADDIPREAVPQAPDFWSEIALLDFFRPITAAMIASARNSAPATGGSTPSNNPALVILTELLLERALARQGQNRLITHFNALQKGGSAIDQFATLILAAAPIIAVETNQPFVEEVIGQIVRERSNSQNSLPVFSGPEPKVPNGSPALVLVAFQSYPLIPETDRLAHDLSTRDVAAIITCAAFAQVPESLRVITDIVLRLPSMDADIFEKLFEQVMGAPVPANWRQQGDAWSRFVLHTDFEHPRRMQLAPDKAFDYIRGQVTDRMTAVDPVQGLGLKQLHGLGEARQFAEDLIADIHAAIQGQIPWTQVDRGALLVGPPGTGKTTLAKAIAKDCKVKFVQGSATAWQSAGHLAEHIMAIRKTFAEARRYAPSILFIDEIDSLGNREQFSGQNASYNTDVVNAVLEQIQGLDTEAPIFVLGATNHEDRVDPALKRSGRMDRVIRIPRPNSEALGHIYGHYLGCLTGGQIDPAIDLTTLGRLSVGLTGADVERNVRGASRRARKSGRSVSQLDIIAEITNKPRNVKNNLRLTPEELERTAYHEAGHAMAMCLSRSEGADIGFATIVPRDDGTLGFVAAMPDERVSFIRSDYQGKIEICLAGRAAEEIHYGEENVSSGATSDLHAATALALDMVTKLGLGQERKLLWSATPTDKDRQQADQLLSEVYDRIKNQLLNRQIVLQKLAEELVVRQELTGDEVRNIFIRG